MKTIIRLLGGVLLAVSLAACHAPASESSQLPAMQLKLYQVPAGQSKAIARHLGAVLEDTGFRTGLKAQTKIRVTQPFPGTVMVLAPASVQPSIGQAIAELGKTAGETSRHEAKAASQSPRTVPVHVHFWLVQAKAGDGTDASTLAALEPTLKQVRSLLGPSHFVLGESVSATTSAVTWQAENTATSSGGMLETNQLHQYKFDPHVTANGEVRLHVEYNDPTRKTIGHLETELTMKPGEYVVLASSPSGTSGSDGTLMNLLVVRVTRVESPAH